jgi:8-amino-7-oxononanoate synthase
LERRLADWVGKERALVFSTGYQVNLGVISSMVARDDFAITDKDDHASIVDGCRLSFGTMKRFPHNDLEGLERVLDSLPERGGRLVIIDGVYSMGGDIAPLPEIIEVCKKYGARLMVDDAHSIGVLGGGRGTAAEFGVTKDVDLIMGTFSKSFASLGGFIAGDDGVIDYIQHHARSLIFSASIPPANAAAAMAALEVMQEEPERIQRLNEIGAFMRQRYRDLGFNIGISETPIIPVVIGEDIKALKFWKALFENGVYTNVVLPPAVPQNQTLLRTSYMATHTDAQLEKVLTVFEKVGKELGVI